MKFTLGSLLDKLMGRAGTINATEYCPPNLEDLVKSMLASRLYDYVWFNYLRVMPRQLKTSAEIICDLHDFQTERVRQDVLPRLKPDQRDDFLRRYESSEFAALGCCQKAIAMSPVEAERFAGDPRLQSKIYHIPATDDIRTQVKTNFDYKYDLVYVGSRSDANIAGLGWFLAECFPLIIAVKPNVTLLIQGTVINAPFIKKHGGLKLNEANITLSGPVENLASIYGDGRVIICPVLHGTGMKIKMIEAMAYGKAIVATGKAVEGIATDLGLTTHDLPNDFASACIEALDNDDSERRMRSAALATFHRDHCRRKVMARCLDAIFE
jgi:glycosyltransferase involved in cell wall biosynthesis